MKYFNTVIAVALLVFCNHKMLAQHKVKTEIDSVSYAIGMDVAKNVKSSFDEFDNDLFFQGFLNVLDSTDVLLTQEEAVNVVKNYFQKKQQLEAAELDEVAEKNNQRGIAFLEANKEKKGVKTTESGLQYLVLEEGTGAKPIKDSKVKVHYHGTLIDGTVFDSSVDRGEPIDFVVSQVIKGWTEGLQLMPEGAKYRFFIPQDLAYGANPRPGGPIKPYETLIFDVELLEVK
ncbi:FKBP-type peptidyl-prolyl cis-trans isomerase [Tamlana sp. 2_MG-2023]|uniref:FKBP-type peptidyl-prolyl cis-trans isomerase n=1 Tax=unclassified Tamlana TaxID=2614803 RepID=UPI0026E15DDB|nr:MULTISPECIES: FKBP-type peptidyl-prolyl cis-trans isomerase [unclassified Tamlana]MDO6761385.1 FKBP-type peptidyl-prolyl cis-trans isomerase [Tamlana sp. 2_MG-2023]MDO6792001.1 FKBP-type peptidyl-prolyl cis-trans isomerase [Tamlana sp. 1_MG-2023]